MLEREDGKGMWWGGTESAPSVTSGMETLGVGRGSVGAGFIGGITGVGPGLDELFFLEVTDNARDLLADTSA